MFDPRTYHKKRVASFNDKAIRNCMKNKQTLKKGIEVCQALKDTEESEEWVMIEKRIEKLQHRLLKPKRVRKNKSMQFHRAIDFSEQELDKDYVYERNAFHQDTLSSIDVFIHSEDYAKSLIRLIKSHCVHNPKLLQDIKDLNTSFIYSNSEAANSNCLKSYNYNT